MTIRLLDCTLRDGGFCNDWMFGTEGIRKVIKGLMDAHVDVIELGYLNNKVKRIEGCTRFPHFEDIKSALPSTERTSKYVMMFDHGSFDVNDIPENDGTIDGIRVAFHKNAIDEAMRECLELKKKGYVVFVQPMLAIRYTDLEYISLISKVNELDPEAFYIVDSYGTMKQKDLIRLFYLVDNNLSKSVKIGFHAHNYKQMAFANAQTFVEFPTSRDLYVDSSIYGMGRGAGNLNTELIIEHLNELNGESYYLKPVLNIMDNVLDKFFQKNHWGYSLAYYLSAMEEVHPHYARQLKEKHTLPVEMISDVLKMIEPEKQYTYDPEYMEQLYNSYMSMGKLFENHIDDLRNIVPDREILLIAPGSSIKSESKRIKQFIDDVHPLIISVNFHYSEREPDYIFVSNIIRFNEVKDYKGICIATSNIPTDNVYIQTSYSKLTNSNSVVKDNAGLMAIKFVINLGATVVNLAGFDGYDPVAISDYGIDWYNDSLDVYKKDMINHGMRDVIERYGKEIKINFITSSLLRR